VTVMSKKVVIFEDKINRGDTAVYADMTATGYHFSGKNRDGRHPQFPPGDTHPSDDTVFTSSGSNSITGGAVNVSCRPISLQMLSLLIIT